MDSPEIKNPLDGTPYDAAPKKKKKYLLFLYSMQPEHAERIRRVEDDLLFA